jgi:hypothetical protein
MKKENTRLLWYNVFNGLKKSGHAFNKKFNGVLKAVGFKRSSFDPCFYFLRDKEELIVVIHVGDFLFQGESERIEELCLKKLSEYMKFTGGNVCHEHVGVTFIHSAEGFFHNQRSKITACCKELQVT